MLLHNHPSGDVIPSWEDFELTKRVLAAGHLMECPLTDHIIVGGITGEWYSIRSQHTDIDFRNAPAVLYEPEQEYVRRRRIGR